MEKRSYKRRSCAGFGKAMSDADGVSLKTLMCATTKPRGTSSVRWRIELRRQAMDEASVAVARHPDSM